MTKNHGLKRAVRQYQADHPGMTYTQALKIVTRDHGLSVESDEEPPHEQALPTDDQ